MWASGGLIGVVRSGDGYEVADVSQAGGVEGDGVNVIAGGAVFREVAIPGGGGEEDAVPSRLLQVVRH